MPDVSEAVRRQWLWMLARHIIERLGGKTNGLQRIPKIR